jgi:hypothetical protein
VCRLVKESSRKPDAPVAAFPASMPEQASVADAAL